VTHADEAAAAEPSAAHRIVSERFSLGPFNIPLPPSEDRQYYSGEMGALFFAPNAWPEDAVDVESGGCGAGAYTRPLWSTTLAVSETKHTLDTH